MFPSTKNNKTIRTYASIKIINQLHKNDNNVRIPHIHVN